MEAILLGALCSDSIQVFGTEDFCAIYCKINYQERFTLECKNLQYIYLVGNNY